MALKNTDPTQTLAWVKLNEHFNKIKDVHMTQWFNEDEDRANRFTIKWDDFFVDYSKNRITPETIDLLISLAEEVGLKPAIESYFAGDQINQTEGRSVLHTALRASRETKVLVDGKNVVPEVYSVRKKIEDFTNSVVNGLFLGYTGKAITDVVNIGIGGSDLGPAMVVDSLKFYKNHLNTHFVSNVDGDHVNEIIKHLNPETTLFVIVSKTFTTQETISNANTIREWFLKSTDQNAISKHFVAVSTNLEKVKAFGIEDDNV